jgi:hypothetical protein
LPEPRSFPESGPRLLPIPDCKIFAEKFADTAYSVMKTCQKCLIYAAIANFGAIFLQSCFCRVAGIEKAPKDEHPHGGWLAGVHQAGWVSVRVIIGSVCGKVVERFGTGKSRKSPWEGVYGRVD